MSGSIAALGFAISSGDAVTAAKDLDSMTAASKRSEKAAVDLGNTAQREMRRVGAAGQSLDKAIAGMSGLDAAIVELRRDMATLATAMDAHTRSTTAFVTGQNAATVATEKLTAALMRQRTVPPMRVPSTTPGPAANNNVNGFNTANVAAQFQDIGITAAMGQSPLQIALQQGTQLSAVLGNQGAAGAARTLGAALMSVVSPVSLITIGIVAMSAAAIQWAMSSTDSSSKIEDALDRQKSLLDELRERYNLVEDAANRAFSAGASGDRFRASASATELRMLMEQQSRSVSGPNSIFSGTQGLGITADFDARTAQTIYGVRQEYSAFKDEILEFRRTIEAGQPSVEAFRKAVLDKWDMAPNRQELTETVRKLLETTNSLNDLANAYREVEAARRQMEARQRGPLIGSSDERDRDAYLDRQRLMLRDIQRNAEAERASLYARSPQELAAAARMRAANQNIAGEGDVARNARIEAAGVEALTRANLSLAEAQQQRMRSLEGTMAQQQLEMALIGKTTGEIARLRMEYELTAQVREEAARNGVAADERELELIRQKAEEYGRFADAIARANLQRDLEFEREQMFRSPVDRNIASRLRGAGLTVDLNSPQAQMMRQMQEFQDAKDITLGFLNTFKSTLMSNGGDIGDALGKAILSALSNSLDKQLANIFDKLATMFADLLTGGGKGGSGLLGSLLGGNGGPNLNYFPPAPNVSRLLAPANSNSPMVGNVGSTIDFARAAAARTSRASAGGSIADYIRQAAIARGIDPEIALRVARSEGGLNDPFRQGESMLSYGREESYGPFQLHMRNGGVGARALAAGIDPRTNWRGGVDYGLDEAARKGWGQWFGAAKVGIGNREGLDGARPLGVYNTGADAAITRMAASAEKASKSLQGFDGGLTEMAGKLTGQAGGVGANLGGLFGTGLNNFGNFQNGRNGGLGALLGYGGGGNAMPQGGGGGGILGMLLGFLPKLFGFAEGTDNAPPGFAWVGERGPEIVKFRGGEQVIPNHKLGGGQAARPTKHDLNIHIHGANGDQHVKALVNQGVQAGIAQFYEQQAQGGFGALQARYASQKG